MRDFRALSLAQGILLFFVGVLSFQAWVWALDREPPVVVLRSQANDAVEPGGTVIILYDVERSRSCAVKLDRDIIDSKDVRVPLVDLDWAAAPGPLGRDRYGQPVTIPNSVNPGIARYRVIAQYRCNLLQWLSPIIVRVETPFVVVAPGQ